MINMKSWYAYMLGIITGYCCVFTSNFVEIWVYEKLLVICFVLLGHILLFGLPYRVGLNAPSVRQKKVDRGKESYKNGRGGAHGSAPLIPRSLLIVWSADLSR